VTEINVDEIITEKCERPPCWFQWWEEFIKYPVEMDSGGMIYTTIHEDWKRNLSNIKVLPQQSEQFERL
jgi:hypothetical protein